MRETLITPMEMVGNVPMQVVGGGPGEGVKEESKYASVVTSSLGIQPSIKEDQSVQYQTIDHKATKVSHPHGSLTAPLGNDISFPLSSVQLILMVWYMQSWDLPLHNIKR